MVRGSGASVADLVERMEALTARLEEQSARLTEQQAEIAHLKSAPTARGIVNTRQTTTRRGVLRGLLATGAAVTALTVAKAETAHAGTRTTVFADNTASYGAAVTYAAGTDPASFLPNLGGNTFGLVASSVSTAKAPTTSALILGTGSGFGGVLGLSNSGVGTRGESDSGYGLYGISNSNVGIAGTSSSNWGLYGFSQSNTGVVGTSQSGWAIWGNSPGNNGVVGQTTSGIGVYGVRTGSGFAGRFDGPVVVNGAFTVAGGPKSAAVPGRGGKLVRMYCQESPEPWFEDFGTVEIKNGRAVVALEDEFDVVVDGSNYRIFLTEIGDCGGLYVSQKGPHRFEIRSRAGAAASGSCDYRVVAKRKDGVGGRFEKVDAPQLRGMQSTDWPVAPQRPDPGRGPGREVGR